MKRFTAVLLAGGQSTRMGVNKALLDYDGTPLWLFQMRKLLQLGPRQAFLSVQPDMHFPSGPWKFAYDRAPNLGPLGGLEAALSLTDEDLLLTLAVDMPAMTAEFLSSLLEKAGPHGVVPQLHGFYYGTTAIYPASILPLVREIVTSDDRSFQHLVQVARQAGQLNVQEIDPAASGLFESWNQPGDLRRAKASQDLRQ